MTPGSIIIPTLNEEASIGAAIASARPVGAEVIVADGGSSDATVQVALDAGARVVSSPRGRGVQLAAGASAARGEWYLFLHADSRLTSGVPAALERALADRSFQVGTFRLSLGGHPLYRLYCWFTRFDSLWTSFGDQGIVIRRGLYEAIGGFPAWPLLEDVALLERARRRAAVRSLPAVVETSSRRFERHGIVRQQIRNAIIIARYLRGTSPDLLAASYAPHHDPESSAPQEAPQDSPLEVLPTAGTSIDIPLSVNG